MKDIVIIANFCRDFSENDNGRFMYLCKELSENNNVEIITSDFSHSSKKHKEPLTTEWPFKITFLHEAGYMKNISLRRFYSHRVWGKNVYEYLLNRDKPDIIYCAVPSLTAAYKASRYSEANKVRFIIDIQDLWPEAFKMVFNIPILKDIIFAPFSKYADSIYKRADDICGVSKTYVNRALSVNKKSISGHAVFLGTNLETFDGNVSKTQPVMRKNKDELWLGYCGSLSNSYDIPSVISALKILKNRGTKTPKFIIMGDGDKRSAFEEYAKETGVDVVFLGSLPYNQMCAQLMECDIVINPIKKGSAASIINKHGDYAAAGKPVINTQDSKEYRELVEDYNMGFNCENGNPEALADRLSTLLKDKDLRVDMGKNARLCAEEKFDRKRSYLELLNCIKE